MERHPADAGLFGQHSCCFPAVQWYQSWELRMGDLRYTDIDDFTDHENHSSVPVSLSTIIRIRDMYSSNTKQ